MDIFDAARSPAFKLLEEQLKIENQRRQEALDLQKEMTQAEIALIKARTDAMQRGDSLITVQGDGLQPHLEYIMWELFRAIQIRVNQDGLDLLLNPA
jgi:hypothetical protein